MRIGIDANRILDESFHGVPLYVESLIQELLKADTHEFVLTSDAARTELIRALNRRKIGCSGRKPMIFTAPRDIRLRPRYPLLAGRPLGWLTRKIDGRILGPVGANLNQKRMNALNIDVYHHPDYLSPSFSNMDCAHVVTIHDVIPLVLPEYCNDGWRKNAEIAYKFAKEKASLVITYSECSKKDIIRHIGVSEDRVQVVSLASRTSVPQEVSTSSMAEVLDRFDLTRNLYVLAVSLLDPRKNFARLVEAFASVVRTSEVRGVKLVLVGDDSRASRKDGRSEIKDAIQKLGIESQVVLTGYLPDTELAGLLQQCACFVYPSLYEGFGLPVLEAMTMGAPVIASNASSVPEVAGDAALLVDPYSVNSIAGAIRAVLEDRELADDLKRRGYIRASMFSWEKTASEHLRLYHEAMQSP